MNSCFSIVKDRIEISHCEEEDTSQLTFCVILKGNRYFQFSQRFMHRQSHHNLARKRVVILIYFIICDKIGRPLYQKLESGTVLKVPFVGVIMKKLGNMSEYTVYTFQLCQATFLYYSYSKHMLCALRFCQTR